VQKRLKVYNITIKPKYLNIYKKSYPLINIDFIDGLNNSIKEGSILNLYSTSKQFIALAYYARQNKGYGWILTTDKSQQIDTNFFINKFKKALQYRDNLFRDNTTTSFRVFNGEGDGIGGLTIDYFDGYFLITWYSEGIYSFREYILEALKSVSKYKGIYQKKRFDTKGKYLDDNSDFVCGTKAPNPLLIKENSVNYAIYLDDGAMVGLFLDQRDVRDILKRRYAKGKKVLNTFSYTGAFSIACAVGGAKDTTSVDLAKRSLPKTKENFEINSIQNQNIVVQDVFEYFKYANRKKLLFDIIILDPPSFARSKKMTFSVSKDYVKLLKEVISITDKNGLIVASTNYANLPKDKFKAFIDKAFKESKTKYKIEEFFSLPKDFRVDRGFLEGDYLKVFFVRKLS